MYIFRKNIRLFNKIQILSSAWSKTIIQTRVNSAFLSSTFLSCLLVETFSCFFQEHPHLYHLQGPLTISHLLKIIWNSPEKLWNYVHFQRKILGYSIKYKFYHLGGPKRSYKLESAVLSYQTHLWAACLWKLTFASCKDFMRWQGLTFCNCGSNESGIVGLHWNLPCNGIIIIDSKLKDPSHQNPNVAIVFSHFDCPHIPRFCPLIVFSGDKCLGILICGIWQITVIVPVYCSELLPCSVDLFPKGGHGYIGQCENKSRNIYYNNNMTKTRTTIIVTIRKMVIQMLLVLYCYKSRKQIRLLHWWYSQNVVDQNAFLWLHIWSITSSTVKLGGKATAV